MVKTKFSKCPYCKKQMEKHIVKEGARYHVHRYFEKEGVVCSEENCEDNHGQGRCTQ